MNPRVAGLVAIGVVMGFAAAWVFRPSPVRWDVDHPHVVLLIGCTLRADQTTVHTPDLATTPFLADLAARGLRFDDAVAAAPWTRAAVAALVTGRHPAEVGLVEPGARRNERPLPQGALTLAEVFGDAGYTTVGVTANPNLDPHFGFDQGFSGYASLSDRWRGEEVVKVYGREPVDAALELVRAAPRDRPVYLQVVLVDAHMPYHLPLSAADAWAGDGDAVARYRALLHAFDASASDLHAGLRELGLEDENTLFVVVSDHGEGLEHPAHHGRGHGRYLYPSTVRMLWLMTGPGITAGVEPALVSQVDVAPTLLGLAGVDAPLQMTGLDVRTERREVAFTDTRFLEVDRSGIYTREVACLVDRTPAPDRVNVRGPIPAFRPGCYDRSDPDFAEPIADRPDLVEVLQRWRAQTDADWASWPAPSAEEAPEAVRRSLQALGYVE